MKKIAVTGGMGYIGSHMCVMLIEAGYEVTIIDNLSNSDEKVLDKIEAITRVRPVFHHVDLCDFDHTKAIFETNTFDAVIHFAGLKAVGESVALPLLYYRNNLIGTLNLLEVMGQVNCKRLVFSSSATVYGDVPSPMKETFERSTTNPYGNTKKQIEEILEDVSKADENWSICNLRYFNPVGAHESGLIGENPNGIPNNLMPFIAKVATGELSELSVFGDDYDTPDGTGVRDYIHVMDLVSGHIKALEYITGHRGLEVFNLGTGVGYSVLEMIHAFEKASGKKIPYRVTSRRAGDIATCYADVNKAKAILNWEAVYSVEMMCRDHWHYQNNNKNNK